MITKKLVKRPVDRLKKDASLAIGLAINEAFDAGLEQGQSGYVTSKKDMESILFLQKRIDELIKENSELRKLLPKIEKTSIASSTKETSKSLGIYDVVEKVYLACLFERNSYESISEIVGKNRKQVVSLVSSGRILLDQMKEINLIQSSKKGNKDGITSNS